LRTVVSELIDALKTQLDPDIPTVLTGHFSTSGAVWGSERSVMLGRDVVVSKSVLADPAFDYVAMGHIHKHQNLTQGETGVPPVVYAGSLERIDFGEENQPKGFCWVELARRATDWEFVPVQARRFVTIRVDLRETEHNDPTQMVLEAIARHDIEDAVVRLIAQTRPEIEARLQDKEIDAALEPANYVAAFVKETEHPERIRLGGDSPETLTPMQLLERYLESRNTSPERTKTLLHYAEEILNP
jgi:exonuclease SbcD